MQLREYFWAFKFWVNYFWFISKQYVSFTRQWRHSDVILESMLLQTVGLFKLVINFCSQSSLRSATDWTAARRSGIFNKMHGALLALHVSQCLHENCPQMLENERWSPCNSRFVRNGYIVSGRRRTELFWNPRPTAKSFWILKVAVWNIWDTFSRYN